MDIGMPIFNSRMNAMHKYVMFCLPLHLRKIRTIEIILVFIIFILFNNTYSIFYRNVYDNQSSNIVIGFSI